MNTDEKYADLINQTLSFGDQVQTRNSSVYRVGGGGAAGVPVHPFSVIGDRYAYVIRHAQKPTEDELKAFLVKHGRDKSDYILCEWVQEVVEVSEAGALPIPKVSKKTLDKWGQP